MNSLKGSILYRGIQGIALVFLRAYQHSLLYILVKNLKIAYSNSIIMAWLLSRNPEKGVLQQSYTFKLLQGCIKALSRLAANLGKSFRASVDNGKITVFLEATVQSFKKSPLALVGFLGVVFMLSNLIVSVVIARGFTYPGTVLRVVLLLIFLLLVPMKTDSKALQNSSVVFRFIKYMVD